MDEEPPADDSVTFCVRCGATDPPFIGALCVRCYSERTPLVRLPPYLDLVLCPTCGSRQVGSHWEKVRGNDRDSLRRSDLERHIELAGPAKLLKAVWEVSGLNPRLRQVDARLTVDVGGTPVEVPAQSEVHMILHSCPECSRRGGHYFTARIQLRPAEEGSVRDLRAFKPWSMRIWLSHLKACSEKQRDAVTREEELKEGWDIFFADTLAARAVARSFKERTSSSIRETASLWGMKNGREIHRLTFLVRLPPVGRGDLLESEGRLWEVRTLGGRGRIEVVDAQEGSLRNLSSEEVGRMRLVSGPEGRQSLPLLFPPQGEPFVRDPDTGDPLPLKGRWPDHPSPGEEAVQEGRDPPRFPVVVGEGEAWWAPEGGKPSRGEDTRQSKRYH